MFQNEKISVLHNFGEEVIETKTCKHCSTSFSITNKDLEFYEKISPTFSSSPHRGEGSEAERGDLGENPLIKNIGERGIKYLIPTPTLCPDCRKQRRLSFRNERKLFRRKCDVTGKDIISMNSPDKKHIIYDQSFWWSDSWNSLDYGRSFDFSKTFFEQFNELLKVTPRTAIIFTGNENSAYTNYTSYLKNSYFIYDATTTEDCYYGYNSGRIKSCVDFIGLGDSEICYECIDCVNCYQIFYSKNSTDCSFSYFLDDCNGCKFCINCSGLTNKEFYVENIFVGKEGFEKKKQEIQNNKGRINTLQNIPKKSTYQKNTENCTGTNLLNSKDCLHCFDITESNSCKFVSNGSMINYCYDIESIGPGGTSRCYELSGAIGSEHILFSITSWGSNIYYSDLCVGKDLFGCIGINQNQQYCILNKQYTKKEYEELVPKIIEHMMSTGEWGEFFPSSLSPFGYNETLAQEYFPLTRSSVILSETKHPLNSDTSQKQNIDDSSLFSGGQKEKETFIQGPIFNWSDYEAPFPKVEKIISVETQNLVSLLDNANNVPDDILNWAIECEITQKPFRIIKQELGCVNIKLSKVMQSFQREQMSYT